MMILFHGISIISAFIPSSSAASASSFLFIYHWLLLLLWIIIFPRGVCCRVVRRGGWVWEWINVNYSFFFLFSSFLWSEFQLYACPLALLFPLGSLRMERSSIVCHACSRGFLLADGALRFFIVKYHHGTTKQRSHESTSLHWFYFIFGFLQSRTVFSLSFLIEELLTSSKFVIQSKQGFSSYFYTTSPTSILTSTSSSLPLATSHLRVRFSHWQISLLHFGLLSLNDHPKGYN